MLPRAPVGRWPAFLSVPWVVTPTHAVAAFSQAAPFAVASHRAPPASVKAGGRGLAGGRSVTLSGGYPQVW
ncbi:hypothetical protein JCM9533A_69310 [Catenuloplanes niger JCM 9533]